VNRHVGDMNRRMYESPIERSRDRPTLKLESSPLTWYEESKQHGNLESKQQFTETINCRNHTWFVKQSKEGRNHTWFMVWIVVKKNKRELSWFLVDSKHESKTKNRRWRGEDLYIETVALNTLTVSKKPLWKERIWVFVLKNRMTWKWKEKNSESHKGTPISYEKLEKEKHHSRIQRALEIQNFGMV